MELEEATSGGDLKLISPRAIRVLGNGDRRRQMALAIGGSRIHRLVPTVLLACFFSVPSKTQSWQSGFRAYLGVRRKQSICWSTPRCLILILHLFRFILDCFVFCWPQCIPSSVPPKSPTLTSDPRHSPPACADLNHDPRTSDSAWSSLTTTNTSVKKRSA